ncbi:S-layer homology domain-containing protein [Saccharibacillus alkalitolerans]|uniref:S-layer homology domain-containing protein n=1 Tax=Saccharibacillus alkalitolerans TaxID=2705290 RepID=A0ABX0F7E4_9BACL|nr:S-layer homology domain-containing protein [Saccharibacillus alkalitolerans]NGZ76881.1 S-layer homology domain-containing protein [Saccharibacillus alkalitolerans]
MNKNWKKWGVSLLGAVFVAGAVWGSSAAPSAKAATSQASQFTDVKSTHWAYSAVQQGVAKGYVDGYTNGTFKPDASVTRAEFVKMVVAAMKLDVKETSGKWYIPYVDAATNKGLYEANDFANAEAAWNKVMTRDEMARVAARAIGETSKEDDKWMYLASKTGLIQGVGKGQIAPEGLTTRAQAVVIIERILSKSAGQDLNVDRYAVGAAEILWHGTNIFTVMPEKFATPESDWKNKGKSSVEEMWNEKAMTLTSNDGLYQSKLDALVAIDMADPNDPNRALLGDINTLKWFNNNYNVKNLMVKNQKDTYVLYFKSTQVFNKDKTKYLNKPFAQFEVRGFNSPDIKEFFAGTLNKTARVYRNEVGDVPATILPKRGTVQGLSDILIMLQTPTDAKNLYKEVDLLRMRGLN